MNSTRLDNKASVYQSNIRAEDGYQRREAWNSFFDDVLIPIGSLFAVFLGMLALMFITH
jgi:hypothetical protein